MMIQKVTFKTRVKRDPVSTSSTLSVATCCQITIKFANIHLSQRPDSYLKMEVVSFEMATAVRSHLKQDCRFLPTLLVVLTVDLA